MNECSIGPRQIRGSLSSTRRPIDIICTPCAWTGMMRFSNIPGLPRAPSMIGTSGPYTSASTMPTVAPVPRSATARFTATVDLPTPPFPDETAIVCSTSGMNDPAAGARQVPHETERHDVLLLIGILEGSERAEDGLLGDHGVHYRSGPPTRQAHAVREVAFSNAACYNRTVIGLDDFRHVLGHFAS